jgi:two-component system, OmpR family, response regulator
MAGARRRILVIEDDRETAEQLVDSLASSGYAVDLAVDGDDGLRRGRSAEYAVMTIDRMLPGMDGIAVIRRLREDGIVTPALIVSALGEVDDRVRGLRAGGDDYLVKPFATDELVARINAVLRRPAQAHNQVLRLGNIALDTGTREVRVADKPALLPRRELTLLELLLRRAGRVVTRNSIADGLYAHGEEAESNAVESHVSRLRKRLATLGGNVAIRTVRGIGYILEERSGAAAEPLD